MMASAGHEMSSHQASASLWQSEVFLWICRERLFWEEL